MKKALLFMGALVAALTLASCNKEGGKDVVNGTDPSSICKENLVAYFPFDGKATETITKTEPKTTGPAVKYTKGRRGQALQGAENGYLDYSLPELGKSLKGFTFAMWLTEPVRNEAPIPSFFQLLSNDFWGDIAFVTDRRPDALAVKTFFRTYNGADFAGDRWLTTDGKLDEQYIWGAAFPVNSWFHIAVSYDAATSEVHTYVNGACVDPTMVNGDGAPVYNPACVKFGDAGPMGELSINSVELLINGWKQKIFDGATDEWMGWMQGAMDEFRIYNKGLSAAEVKELFKAEVSQVK